MTAPHTDTGNLETGDLVELEIGAPAHGGHCVARYEGRIVFVRHALPGEVVKARVTEAGKASFARADAVEIITASADRVPSVWEQAGPGGVGGAELAHVSLAGQHRWKSAVIAEQLRRLAGMEVTAADVPITAAPGDAARGGLGWRTRFELTVTSGGRGGMHRFRSHDVLPLDSMPLATAQAQELAELNGVFRPGPWRKGARIEVVAPASGSAGLVLVDGVPWHHGRADHRENTRRSVAEQVTVAVGAPGAGSYEYRVAGAGFWQVHDEAPSILASAVMAAGAPVLGEGARVLDLYSGAGLFSVPLAAAVGASGAVTSVEGDAKAVRDARRNTRDLGQVSHVVADVASYLRENDHRADLVVLDPPRVGGGRQAVAAIAGTAASRVVYVACDPAALARDIGYFAEHGFAVDTVTAFDLFPMTHHVECVAVLTR